MTNQEEEDSYSKCNKKIDELYTFRDKYYIVNSNKTSDDRSRELTCKLSELVSQVEASQFDSKANYLTLIGKAFNVLPEFSQKSFDSLTKAIKLDPKSIEAWNNLGECYWKKRDFEMCKNCFERSVQIKKTKLSLRGMAMVMRQLINVPNSKEELATQTNNPQQTNDASSTTTEVAQQNNNTNNQQNQKFERIKHLLDESVRYAKESLQLDLKDGMSWYILANCYVAKFFSPFGQQNPGLLKQAITAYNLALKDESASLQSDLYFNKSMISMYEENWSDVLVSLCSALRLDPNWSEARGNLKGALDYLGQINEMIVSRGKLKAKKFQSLVESISKADLGPYLDGYQKNAELTNERVGLKEARLSELESGLNAGKVLVGKVICGLPSKREESFNMVCFTCCVADANGDCAALTIYNLAGGHGVIIGNSVAIPEPWIENVELRFKLSDFLNVKLDELNEENEYEFKFKSVRVENPTVLVVNGKKWTKEKVSSAFFVPKVIAD